MNMNPVVEQDVSANCVFGLLARSEMLPVQAFALERPEKRFGAGVIVRHAGAAHALERAVRGDLAPEIP